MNQMLAGSMPQLPTSTATTPHLRYFTETLRSEYHANLIQLVRWPGLYPKDVRLSLDHWCMLRGFASALEATFRYIALDGLTAREAVRIVAALDVRMTAGGETLGLSKQYGPWFARRWPAHVATALMTIVEERPPARSAVGIRAVSKWWVGRYRK